MRHFLAILEDSGSDRAVGVWFPDVPGCFSSGDTIEEAMLNAREALASHIEILRAERMPVPSPRAIEALRSDPEFAADIERYIVAAIPFDDAASQDAAE